MVLKHCQTAVRSFYIGAARPFQIEIMKDDHFFIAGQLNIEFDPIACIDRFFKRGQGVFGCRRRIVIHPSVRNVRCLKWDQPLFS